ncbi:hypothetical protein RMCBS344292_00972 [Rhizopus microsporus]|nr:hypothetical protein RMCBS344292_00972 [Rhizopus microsporus]
MSAYTIYEELFPPQTVEQVETCHFTSPDAINLIVAKASLLQIYQFVEYVPNVEEEDETLSDNELAKERLNDTEDRKDVVVDSTSGRLELVAQFKLHGIISTMGTVRTNSSRGKEGCDSLLLGFSDAKMSLLEWSSATNSIVTVSIHYYERDEFKKEFLANPNPSSIHIDPQQRCAVLNFYDNKLAVLPFRQTDKLDERPGDADEDEEKWPYQPSFVIDLSTLDSRIKNIIDMSFLSDYYEPTLAILFQPEQTWTGRLANNKDTVSLVVISLDLTAKVYPIIYSIDKLPYDCLKLVPMPKPVTGMLVIAANSLLHISQGSPGVGVAVNGYTKKTTDFPGMLYESELISLGFSLEGAKALTFGGDRCLIFMQNGNWALVQFKMDGSKVVGMDIVEIKHTIPLMVKKPHRFDTPPLLATVPSCITNVKQNEYFFLGSRVGDSLLIKYCPELMNSTSLRNDPQHVFRVCDTLLNTGPIVDMAKMSKTAGTYEFDEVDMDLYGEEILDDGDSSTVVNNQVNEEAVDMPEATNEEKIDESNVSLQGVEINEMTRVSFWCFIYTTAGSFNIYSLPDFKECFTCPQFNIAPDLIIDNDQGQKPKMNTGNIQEILMTNIGKERKDPHLVARTDTNDIVIYKTFSYLDESATDNDRLALRFSRVHHEYVSKNTPSTTSSKKSKKRGIIDTFEVPDGDLEEEEEDLKTSRKTERKHLRKLLIPFTDVAGYAGIFLAGPQPAWLMCSFKSFVRVHPMKTEHEIVGFTQFHNVNCKHGFITLDSKSDIRLSRLRTDGVNYDLDWVIQKVPLGQTVHKIQYHPIMRVYAVLVSQAVPVRMKNDDNQYIDGKETDERAPGEFLPELNKFSMVMVSPVTWEIVDTVEFEEFEQCFSLECALLDSKQTSTGRKYYVVVGTGSLKGEDTTMKGSIRIFDIIEVVPEPDNPQTNHKFKRILTEDVKGAVTAMCTVSGHLTASIGSKVIVWSLEDDERLVGVAFIDVQIYVTSMSSIKNFILIGDAQKSIWFLGFQLEPAKLSLLGKDYQSFDVGCVDFIIDDKSLYLVVGDTSENIDLYQYAPFNLQSFGGQKLMRRGDFHVGSQVQTMVRLPQIEKSDKGLAYSRRHFCLCGTFNGSISVISPISEKTFKRLNTLYGQLVNNLQHVAGLNPRAFRLIKGPKQRMSSNRTKAVLDGDLVFSFAGLSIEEQKETTKQIGTTVTRIMEDLVDIECSINHF